MITCCMIINTFSGSGFTTITVFLAALLKGTLWNLFVNVLLIGNPTIHLHGYVGQHYT